MRFSVVSKYNPIPDNKNGGFYLNSTHSEVHSFNKSLQKKSNSYRQKFLIATSWLVIWCIIQTLVYHRVGIDWSMAWLESIITTLVLAVAGIIIANTFKFYSPVSKNYGLMAGYIIILSMITGRVLIFFFSHLHANDTLYTENSMKFMPLRGMFYFLMVILMTAYFWIQKKMKEDGSTKQRQEEAATLMREAELAKLRQQLQPHFLFNSLNSISALAGSRPEEARKMIQQLSDFLRGTLRKDDQQLVTLEDEIKHLSIYLDIEKVRFGHRLNTDITLDSDSLDKMLPSLLLQPLVENAVKFGLYDTTEAVVIQIKSVVASGQLIIEISNPFDPQTARPTSGTGFGLSSVQRRLYLLYARNDLLEISQHETVFTTKIKIPQQA